MQKTSLGISVGLLGGIICLLGAVFGLQWYFLAIVAFVLLKEQNEWLRRLVLKVVIILVSVSVLCLLVNYAFGVVFDIVHIGKDGAEMLDFAWITNISTYVTKYLRIIMDVVLVIIGIKAFSQKHTSIKAVDNLIAKNV